MSLIVQEIREPEERIRELERDLSLTAENANTLAKRIARAREILKEYLKETNYFYSGSKVRTPMEDRMAKALDALEGKE